MAIRLLIFLLFLGIGCADKPESSPAETEESVSETPTESDTIEETTSRQVTGRPRLGEGSTGGGDLPECHLDADCPTGKVCDTITFRCIQAPPPSLACSLSLTDPYEPTFEVLEDEERRDYLKVKVSNLPIGLSSAYLIGLFRETADGRPEMYDEEYRAVTPPEFSVVCNDNPAAYCENFQSLPESVKIFRVKIPLSGTGTDAPTYRLPFIAQEMKFLLETGCGMETPVFWDPQYVSIPVPSIEGVNFALARNSLNLEVDVSQISDGLSWEVECDGETAEGEVTRSESTGEWAVDLPPVICPVDSRFERIVVKAHGVNDQLKEDHYCLVLKPLNGQDFEVGYADTETDGASETKTTPFRWSGDDPSDPAQCQNQYPNQAGPVHFSAVVKRRYEIFKIPSDADCDDTAGMICHHFGCISYDQIAQAQKLQNRTFEYGRVEKGWTWMVQSVEVRGMGGNCPAPTPIAKRGPVIDPPVSEFSCNSGLEEGNDECTQWQGDLQADRSADCTGFKLRVRDVDNTIHDSGSWVRMSYRSDFMLEEIVGDPEEVENGNPWNCEIQDDPYPFRNVFDETVYFPFMKCVRLCTHEGLLGPAGDLIIPYKGCHLKQIFNFQMSSYVERITPEEPDEKYYTPGNDSTLQTGTIRFRGTGTPADQDFYEELINAAQEDEYLQSYPHPSAAHRTILIDAFGYSIGPQNSLSGGLNDSGIHRWALELECSNALD